jgi:hypothetical protein
VELVLQAVEFDVSLSTPRNVQLRHRDHGTARGESSPQLSLEIHACQGSFNRIVHA